MAKTLKQDTFAFRYVVQEAKALYYFHFLEDKNPRQDQLKTWQTQNDDYESSQLQGSPDSTAFAPPGIRTIGKTVLIGDWFSTKSTIYDF